MGINASDIKSILASGEGYNAEFKEHIPRKVKTIAEEVCAFANAAGGVLLLGVNDNNEIKGITIKNRQRSAIEDTLHQINPALHCPFYLVEINKMQVGVIEVPSGKQKPYTLSGVIYIRQGSN